MTKPTLRCGEVCCDVGKALLEEGVVAEVGVGEVGDGGEVNDDRERERVAEVDGEVEGVVVAAALGALHPVDDAAGVFGGRAGAADGDAGIVGEGAEGCGMEVSARRFRRDGRGRRPWLGGLGAGAWHGVRRV